MSAMWGGVSRGALILCAAAGGAPALAQSGAAPARQITIGVTGQATYDSNTPQSGAIFAEARGLEREDVRFTPAVTIDAVIPIGRQTLSLGGSVGYDFYARNTQLNSERIGLDAAAGLKLAGCDVGLSAGYSRRQTALGDFFILGPVTPDGVQADNVEDIKTVGANATCGDAIGIRPTASVSHTWVDNSNAFRTLSDSRSLSARAGVSYARPAFGSLSLFGSYARATYPGRDEIGLAGADSFETYGAGVRFSRDIGSRLRGVAEVSYTSADSGQDDVDDFSGITWSLQLTADVTDRLQGSFDVSRAIQPSNRIDATYSVTQSYGANFSYALGPRVQLTASALYRDRDLRGAVLLGGFGITEDELTSFSAGARYQLNRRFSLNANVARESRRTNNEFFDYDSTRVSAGFAATF